jgi:hypothetical protein
MNIKLEAEKRKQQWEKEKQLESDRATITAVDPSKVYDTLSLLINSQSR